MPTQRSTLGQQGEDAAAAYLQARGWQIVARNVRRREGEVDLVARRDGTLSFIEVKTRRSDSFGTPAEAVTYRKQARIRKLAASLLAADIGHAPLIRFDVIEARPAPDGSFSIRHIEEAF